jgi:hypothetical protein
MIQQQPATGTRFVLSEEMLMQENNTMLRLQSPWSAFEVGQKINYANTMTDGASVDNATVVQRATGTRFVLSEEMLIQENNTMRRLQTPWSAFEVETVIKNLCQYHGSDRTSSSKLYLESLPDNQQPVLVACFQR